MLSLILTVVLASGIGAVLGYFGQCSSGTCPLTSTWWRGALYGGAMGLMLYFASGKGGVAAPASTSKNVTPIKQEDFEKQVLKSAMPVVVDFYADWCGPCKVLAPMLDKAAEPMTNKVKFVKVDVDKATKLAQQYQIRSIPTLMFFKSGKVVDQIVGLPSAEELKKRLQAVAETR